MEEATRRAHHRAGLDWRQHGSAEARTPLLLRQQGFLQRQRATINVRSSYVVLVRHARTGKSPELELPEDPVWDMVDNADKREEAKVDKAILEAKSELED